ncbi:MAG: molybdopterin molybdotransferase MoeA [Desulfobulbaceae bacterium]|nr:molybdopterin molybdotransferase MoeA [Desulfobulbaceae bacterium]
MHNLEKAQEIILSSIKQLPGELVGLRDGLRRTVFSDVAAIVPSPSFDESMRDGYVFPLPSGHDTGIQMYTVIDEIPAGRICIDELLPGTACRIMTGGCVPEGGACVVPYENCAEQNGEVAVEGHLLQSTETYIRKTGSETSQSDILVQCGTQLQPMHLSLLSSSGVSSVVVSTRPSAGFLCTGSELKSLSGGLEKGEKFSSNSFLLEGLLTSSGACSEDLGIIGDNKSDLLDFFIKAKGRGLDLLISTGGTGPGKYDLVRDAFVKSGGQMLLTALDMRPGKSLLFGILGSTLFFGLPGPPFAVQTLFNVLVAPAILAMQGRKERLQQKVQAHLEHQITVKRNDVLRFKDGVLALVEGRCSVRLAERFETVNCYIMLQPGESGYSKGKLVDVLLAFRYLTPETLS